MNIRYAKQGRNLVLCSLIFGSILLLALSFSAPSGARAEPNSLPAVSIHYVAPGGSCGGLTPCYDNVQAAVDAAAPNDEIRVAAGTYTGVQFRPRRDTSSTGVVAQVVYVSQTVTIRGGFTTSNWSSSDPNANPTFLNAGGQGRVMYITGNISPTIEGLRLTGGRATGQKGDPWFNLDAGGGIYIVTATASITANQILSGTAYFGGGIYINQAKATLSNNTISMNTTGDGSGGGVAIWFSDAILAGNTISANSRSGIWLYGGTPTFSRNVIMGNTTPESGGGVSFYYGSGVFKGNKITHNSAGQYGGGVILDTYSSASFDGDIISNNTALRGGALYEDWHSFTVLKNTLIADNQVSGQGSGLYLNTSSSLQSQHMTMARNTGGDGTGAHIAGGGGNFNSIAMTNTVLVSHTVGISVTGSNTVTVNSVLWFGTPLTITQSPTAIVSVRNQHEGNPAFALDGYHLTSSSAAINQGILTDVVTDIDGDPRCVPDLGVDEFTGGQPCERVFLPILLR